MPCSPRNRSLFVAVAGLLLVDGCSSAAPAPRSCQSSAECSAAARCVAGTCVANAPPSASIALPPGPLEATLLLRFDGSGSADPDPGDAIATHAWTIRAVAADCAPPVVAGTGPVAQVRFACPGTYAVDLAVADQMNAQGVATRELQVAPYSGPALLTIGPDVAVAHVCTTGPRRCAPDAAVTLSATPTAAAPADLVFAWTVEPPAGLTLDASRRVTFTPGVDAPSPTVSIETDGQAISGDWIFRVEARDAAGVVASGATRVSLANRAPVVTGTVPVPDHLFDGAQFSASGEIPFTVSDPDGDDLVGPSVEWRHVGDGGGSFTGVVNGAQSLVTFAVQVPYTTASDAGHLIGGVGLERTIVFTIRDANGGVTVQSWPIAVGNRPPTVVTEPAAAVVDHRYDPVALAYVASPLLTTWADPDGDPLAQVPGSDTGDLDCPSFEVSGNGVAVARCILPFTGSPATLANFVHAHAVAQRVQDPWAEAARASTVQFSIGNRPPAITTTAPFLYVPVCVFTTCCAYAPAEGCVTRRGVSPAGTATVTSRWDDPDGDPLDIQVGAGPTVTPAQPLVCTPAACALRLDLVESAPMCGFVTETLSMSATDGVDVATGSLPVERDCLL